MADVTGCRHIRNDYKVFIVGWFFIWFPFLFFCPSVSLSFPLSWSQQQQNYLWFSRTCRKIFLLLKIKHCLLEQFAMESADSINIFHSQLPVQLECKCAAVTLKLTLINRPWTGSVPLVCQLPFCQFSPIAEYSFIGLQSPQCNSLPRTGLLVCLFVGINILLYRDGQ